MRLPRILKQLILTADDFGRSAEVNAAIERCHRAGFLMQASLMVNETAVAEAVEIAKRNPQLCIGLHLSLCDGLASRPSALTDLAGRFPASHAQAGMRYFFRHRLVEDLQREIEAQFDRFLALGFVPSYWDGHAHLHLHPTILKLALPIAHSRGFRAMRLVQEPGAPAILPWIFSALSAAAAPALTARGIAFADQVFGLRDTGRMDAATMMRILEALPEGRSELYFHPGADPEISDFGGLMEILERREIGRISSVDLAERAKRS